MKTFTLTSWTLNEKGGLIFTGYADVPRPDMYGAKEVSGVIDLNRVAYVTVGATEFGVVIDLDLNGCEVRLKNGHPLNKEPFALAEQLGLDIPDRMRVQFKP